MNYTTLKRCGFFRQVWELNGIFIHSVFVVALTDIARKSARNRLGWLALRFSMPRRGFFRLLFFVFCEWIKIRNEFLPFHCVCRRHSTENEAAFEIHQCSIYNLRTQHAHKYYANYELCMSQ